MGTWWPGEAAHPAITSMGTWESKCQTAVHVLLLGEVQVPTPSSWGMVQHHLQGNSPSQVDLLAPARL